MEQKLAEMAVNLDVSRDGGAVLVVFGPELILRLSPEEARDLSARLIEASRPAEPR